MISIILPVKTEPYLGCLLWQLQAFIKQPYEVKVQTEEGLGYAIMCGIKQAKGTIIVSLDSDGSHSPYYIPQMVKLLNHADIIVGSRYVKGGSTKDSFMRKLISRTYCQLAQTLFGLKVKDNMSGFIVTKKEVFTQYPIRNNGYKWGLDLLCRSKNKLRVIEYPICFSKRKAGKSKANLSQGIQTLMFMIKLFKEQYS